MIINIDVTKTQCSKKLIMGLWVTVQEETCGSIWNITNENINTIRVHSVVNDLENDQI